MRRRPPVHPEFELALKVLASAEPSPADALRLLIPTAARVGMPRPSYFSVRRILLAERRRLKERAERRDRRDQIIADLLSGLVMRPMWLATQPIEERARAGRAGTARGRV